jgi:hypothetical protein
MKNRQSDTQSIQDAMRREGWTLNGPQRIVKVIPRFVGFPLKMHGYITQEKYLLGKLPAEIETKLGLPSRFLADGCRIFGFKRLPMDSEVDYELTAKFPGGQAFNPAMDDARYLPASNATHQWCLLADLPTFHIASLTPTERYPYKHG